MPKGTCSPLRHPATSLQNRLYTTGRRRRPAVGVVEQPVHLPRRITAADTLHVFEVRALHADEQIVLLVVLRRELARSVSLAGNAVLGELAPRGRIDGIADLIAARRRGVDLKFVGKSCLFDQVLHHKFRHRAAADIAQADK